MVPSMIPTSLLFNLFSLIVLLTSFSFIWKYNGVMGLLIGTTYLGVCTCTSVMGLHTKHAMKNYIKLPSSHSSYTSV